MSQRHYSHAVHAAVMEEHGIKEIITFDAGFDGYPGIVRRR